ncbi:MAG: MFS transporter [bacterium]
MKEDNPQAYRSFIRCFYLYRFFTDFVFVYAVYIILFKRNGLSVLEISLLLALWCAFVVVFEVPTGALADRWNRVSMLRLGLLSKAVGFGIWFFADRFWLFALGFLFWGIQETFSSGTLEAILYDTLKDSGKEEDYIKIAGRGHFYARIGIAVSVFFGGIIASWSCDLVIILSSVSMIAAILPTLFFRDVRVGDRPTRKNNYIAIIREAFRISVRNRMILRLFCYTAVVVAVIGILDEYEQLYLDWVRLPIALFCALIVVRMGFEAVGSRFAHIFQRRFLGMNNIYLLGIAGGILLLLSTCTRSRFMLPIFASVFLFGSMGEVLVEGGLQEQIRSDQRATIMSMNSLLLALSAILLSVGFGVLSKFGNLTWGFRFFAFLMIVYSTVSLIFQRKA